jgi:tRNA C32,U32 (ribose-2'-O)-methylase TrmJ
VRVPFPTRSGEPLQSEFVVVLSNPETPMNIGSVARTMKAYGLNDLRLVGIPPVEEDSKAFWTTCGGEDVLRNAKYYPDVSAATADCAQSIGFTRRVRDKSQRLFDFGDMHRRKEGRLPEDHPHFHQLPVFAGSPQDGAAVPLTALVFGCESKGLLHEETLCMTHLVRIALAAEDMSLNLSHAVTVVLHALTSEEIQSGPWSHPHAGPASTLEESEAAFEEFIEALDRTGYLGKSGKESIRREKIGVLWRRLRPTRRELDFMRGALQALAGIPSRRAGDKSAKAADPSAEKKEIQPA